MSISFPFSNKAELHVEVGKTSVEELQKFQEQVTAKGGGDLRAKKNSDGSHTLYVSADTKVTMRGLFGASYGSEARTAKLDLAKDLVKEIISRRMPEGAGETSKALMSRIDDRNSSTELGAVLKEVSKVVYDTIPESAKKHYGELDTIMSTPSLREAFGKSMSAQFVGENFDFLCLERAFSKTENPHEKMKLAEEMFKMVESAENPPGQGYDATGPDQINISGEMASKIYDDIQHLRGAIVPGREPAAADKEMLNNLFSPAKNTVSNLVKQNDNLAKFVASDGFKNGASDAYAKSALSPRDANPASYLAPGSGKEYLEEVEKGRAHFSRIENILEDPEMNSAFREHLVSSGQTESLKRYEGVEFLEGLADSDGVDDSELLAQAEAFFLEIPKESKEHFSRVENILEDPEMRSAFREHLVSSGQTEPLDHYENVEVLMVLADSDDVDDAELLAQAELLFLGTGNDAAEGMDPHKDFVSRQLSDLRRDLNAVDLMGGSAESRAEEDKLFGPIDEIPIRSKIKDFIGTMKADAENGLRAGGCRGFQGEKLDGLIREREASVDPHKGFISRELTALKQDLANAVDLRGGSAESLAEQDNLFGPMDETPSKEILIRGKIKGFIATMKADAENGLRAGGSRGFQGEKLDGLIGKRVGEKMLNEQLEWRPDAEQHYGAWDQFAGKELVSSGGATGSGRTKDRIGKQLYQVKGSIEHAGLGRRLKAGGLNTENYGEVIASNTARAIVGSANRGQIPEVSLRQDGNSHEAMVTSKYLTGGKGDLKELYVGLAGPLPKGQKHPKVHLDSSGPSGDGILRLGTTASRDVQRNIALSALMGDHDVNPGNMIALKDGHVGRIDFGHAFNELINGPGGSATGGGGVRNKSNRILDFFNRETVSGVPFTAGQKSKLWRDYTGAGPSDGMTDSLRSIASSTEALDGLVQSKTQFADLIVALEAEGTPEAKKQIEDLTKSLIRMSQNIEKPITSTDPGAVVKEVFDNLAAFVTEGQDQMREVADLSDLQTKIDAHVTSTRENPDAPVPPEITQLYQDLSAKSVKSPDGEGLCWMKITAGSPAFTGDLAAYVQTRRVELE